MLGSQQLIIPIPKALPSCCSIAILWEQVPWQSTSGLLLGRMLLYLGGINSHTCDWVGSHKGIFLYWHAYDRCDAVQTPCPTAGVAGFGQPDRDGDRQTTHQSTATAGSIATRAKLVLAPHATQRDATTPTQARRQPARPRRGVAASQDPASVHCSTGSALTTERGSKQSHSQ